MENDTSTDVDELITFGQMALEQGWYDQARDYFEQALALDASNREAMKGLAKANEILGRRASQEQRGGVGGGALLNVCPVCGGRHIEQKSGPLSDWLTLGIGLLCLFVFFPLGVLCILLALASLYAEAKKRECLVLQRDFDTDCFCSS